ARACPPEQADAGARLHLRAIAAAASLKEKRPPAEKGALQYVTRVLADDRQARENFDLITNHSDDIPGYVTTPQSPERKALATAWGKALDRLIADPTISTADRLVAVQGHVALALLDAPKGLLPDTLLKSVREQVARADRETSDPYARQAVISAAAELLTEAKLIGE